MNKIRQILKEEKYYLSVLLSFMLNTVCSRIVDQTDLIMMNRFSPVSAAALIAVKNIAVIDFVIALTIVPIFTIIIKKGETPADRNKLMGIYTKKYAILALFTTLLCAALYPLFITFSAKDAELKRTALLFILPLVLNIPAKMFQFLGSSFLCAINKSKYVGTTWIAIAVLNFALNTVFMRLMGSIDSLVATIILTLGVCAFFFYILERETGLLKFLGGKAELKDFKKPIFSECIRIIIERSAGYVFFFFLLHYSSVSYVSWIGIILETVNLLLVPFIASMRSSALCFDEADKNYLFGKLFINITFAFVLSVAFLALQSPIFCGLYEIESINSAIFKIFAFCLPVILISEAFSNIIRGFLQFQLKQPLILKIESIINYFVFIPAAFFILKNSREYLYPVILAALYGFQALCYLFWKLSANKKY